MKPTKALIIEFFPNGSAKILRSHDGNVETIALLPSQAINLLPDLAQKLTYSEVGAEAPGPAINGYQQATVSSKY